MMLKFSEVVVKSSSTLISNCLKVFITPINHNTGITKSTNKTITVDAVSVIDGNYISFNAVFGALTESDFYILEVVYSNNIIYKDKIFCTDQAINQSNDEYYSVNKDKYISEESSDNEFIII